MSKRCKMILYIITGSFILLIIGLLVKLFFFSGLFVPMLKVKGDKVMEVQVSETFQDPGFKARINFKDFSDQVHVKSNLDTKKLGTYTITYTADTYRKSVTRKVKVVDHKKPVISLQGPDMVRVFENGTYQEPGYQAKDNYDGDITTKVTIDNKVNIKKIGTYTITYHVQDSSGNKTQRSRKVQVCADPTSTKVYYNHDQYDNTAEEWWFRKSEDHKRTTAAKDEAWLKGYDTYFLGPEEKVIYLTFDEGGNDITYIKEIAEVLKENDVVATYFLTRNYIKDNPEFMNDLVKSGNVIGNHTWHHYDMTTLANAVSIDKFVSEITETEKTYMEVTGQPMQKIFRFPKGGSSERAMKIVQDLGYSTYNWSHAYYDFASDVSGMEALKTMMDHYHEGAIYLLHPSNKGNYDAMDTFIKNMKGKGYTFKTVDTIPEVKKNKTGN